MRILRRLRFDVELQRAAAETPVQLRAEPQAALVRHLSEFESSLGMYRGAWESTLRAVSNAFDARLSERRGAIASALVAEIAAGLAGDAHPRSLLAPLGEKVTGLAQARLEALRDELRSVAREILQAEAMPLADRVESWVGGFTQSCADLFDLPAVPLDLPVEIKESRGFTFKWQDDLSLLPTFAMPPTLSLMPHRSAAEAARRSLESRMGEFVDRNCGRLRYHFQESMKAQWREPWRRIESALEGLERSLREAADVLGSDDPENMQRLAECGATLQEIERIERMLPNV